MFCDWTFHSGSWSSVMLYSAVHYSVRFVFLLVCEASDGGAFMSRMMCRSASSSPRQWSPQSSLGCSTRRSQSSRSKYCVLEPGTPGVQQLWEVWRLWHPSETGRPAGLYSRRGYCESDVGDKRRQKREMELKGMLRCVIAFALKQVHFRGSVPRRSKMARLAPACHCK